MRFHASGRALRDCAFRVVDLVAARQIDNFLGVVAALLLRLVWLGLLLLASLTSRLLALLLGLATLRLTLHLLVLALLRLLLVLARLRLPSRLLLLGLPALLGLPLLALSTLRLAGAALLVACSCGAAFGLRAALGTGLAG